MKFDDILKRTLNKVNESYDIRTGIGSDVRNVDYGKYVVIFSDGDQIEVEADSKFDAKNKALKQNPGKTPTNVKKVEEGKLSDFNKDDEKTPNLQNMWFEVQRKRNALEICLKKYGLEL